MTTDAPGLAGRPGPLGTDWHKEFLETASYLIVVFRIDFGLTQTAEGEMKPTTITFRSPSGSQRDSFSRPCI